MNKQVLRASRFINMRLIDFYSLVGAKPLREIHEDIVEDIDAQLEWEDCHAE